MNRATTIIITPKKHNTRFREWKVSHKANSSSKMQAKKNRKQYEMRGKKAILSVLFNLIRGDRHSLLLCCFFHYHLMFFLCWIRNIRSFHHTALYAQMCEYRNKYIPSKNIINKSSNDYHHPFSLSLCVIHTLWKAWEISKFLLEQHI